ncbi:MAG: FHA domain-containing protein [Candidatus Eremiobacteraeota bacterium]|nr:FHA domain-containing protein [Candidatus Eremiobacteraeota bacterium]
MLKRILINALFIVMGCTVGLVSAQVLKNEFNASSTLCVIAIFFFLAVFIGAAQLILIKLERPFGEMPPPLVKSDQTWGWLIPRKDASKAGYPLIKDRVVVGRDVKSDIFLNDDSISRSHAELVRNQDSCIIRDLGSRNGLFVNNQRVKEQILTEGDSVTIGNVDFFFRTSKSTAKE